MIQSLHNGMSVKGINDIQTIQTLYHEFLTGKTYDWWHKVQPGDIVMDLGACNGMFTCQALDMGASKVYAVEANPELCETILINAMPHIKNKAVSPVSITNCFIGDVKDFAFGDFDLDKVPARPFMDLIKDYDIDHLDFLKIDCEGGEFSVFTDENIDWIVQNVTHIAVEFHMNISEDAVEKYKHIRNVLFKKFPRTHWKINYRDNNHRIKANDDEWLDTIEVGKDQWGTTWMTYITNYKKTGKK